MPQDIKKILQEFWGHNNFRGSQEKIIQSVIGGQDVLALMPTGGGKSICYQVPALSQDGICIVVSPLIALIQDQVRQLKEKGIKAVALTGGMSFEELNNSLDNCLYGNYKFLYLSPERLQQSLIQERIQQMEVNLIAIDEAHCISQWGNDFRPAYLHCAILRDLAPTTPLIALTATATTRVAKDIVENLGLEHGIVHKDSFARPNIVFHVKRTEDKLYQLKRYLEQVTGSAIVYVRSRKMSVFLADFLNKNHFKATFFHGGISKVEKEERLSGWVANTVDIMVATNAFGMGVDKANVRLVIHYQIPDSLESYFQEAGRAGRDGNASRAILLTSGEDEKRAKQQFLSSLPTVSFVKALYAHLNTYFQVSYGDSISEILTLKFNTFCKRYDLNPNMTYNGLRILDQNSVVSLSENFNEKTLLKFVAPRADIFNYLDTHRKSAGIIQTILRTYGGITDFETRIKIPLIQKKTRESEKKIKQLLKQLHKDGIVEYKHSSSDLELLFLVPREDDRTINVFAQRILDLNAVKEKNLDTMLDYVRNTNSCRSVFLLNYFGEKKKERCGRCDICSKGNKGPSSKILAETIIGLLKSSPLNSRQLASAMEIDESFLLKTLKILLEEEDIVLNHKNEYEINSL